MILTLDGGGKTLEVAEVSTKEDDFSFGFSTEGFDES